MIDKMGVLATLYLLRNRKLSVTTKSMRHGRVILCLLSEDLISDYEYFQSIEDLEEEGYISVVGKVQNECEIKITRKGEALIKSLAKRKMGQTEFERLSRLINNYLSSTSEFMSDIAGKLKQLQEKRKEKILESDPKDVRALGILLEISLEDISVIQHKFQLTKDVMKNDGEKLDWSVVSLRNQLTIKLHLPIAAYRQDDHLFVISYRELDEIDFLGAKLTPLEKSEINQKDVPDWKETLASNGISNWLRHLGYIQTRHGHLYMRTGRYETTDTNVGIIREYDSLNLNIHELEQNLVFVWIEHYSSFRKTVLDLLKEQDIDLLNKEEMKSILSTVKLRIMPSFRDLELEDVQPNVNLMTAKVPTTQTTYAKYWEDRYDMEFTESTQPIIILKGFPGPLHYPAEAVSIDRYEFEHKFGKIMGRGPKHERPKVRVEHIEDLAKQLNSVMYSYITEYATFKIKEICPTADKLIELGQFQKLVKISPPLLEFSRNEIRLDPMDLFYDPKIEPQCGKKNIEVTHFITPKQFSQEDIEKLISSLNSMLTKFGFGSLRNAKNMVIIKYDPELDVSELETRIRSLDKKGKNGNLGIAIIPDDSDIHYYSLKKIFPTRTGVPLQEIRMSTITEILNNRFKGSVFLSIKLLIKTLNEGEAIWTLYNSAGLSREKSLFIGIGFSRYPRQRRVSKCAAVMHGPHGDRITWKVFSTPQERTITKQWFDTLLLRIQDIVETERSNRIVFYRTGTLFPIERNAIQQSLSQATWVRDIKASFISIKDGKDFRLCMSGGDCKNIPTGYGIIQNPKEALLSTSNYDERELQIGTVIPMLLKMEFGEDDITDIVKEYHDLTYLNWRSPITTAKKPFVLKVAERFSELHREGVPSENMFYLDL